MLKSILELLQAKRLYGVVLHENLYLDFSQEGLCQQCVEAMIETIQRETVCAYHTAATQYCETVLQRKCVEWLERRLTSETSVSLLADIRCVT